MGYYQRFERCARCGGLALRDDHASTGDWWQICTRCGLDESRCLYWDDDGNPVWDGHGVYTRSEARGAYRLSPRDGSDISVGTLPDDFRPEMLNERFDTEALERDFDRGQSYVTYFDPDAGTLSILWGDLEPPMFVEGVHDTDEY